MGYACKKGFWDSGKTWEMKGEKRLKGKVNWQGFFEFPFSKFAILLFDISSFKETILKCNNEQLRVLHLFQWLKAVKVFPCDFCTTAWLTPHTFPFW